ncbi:FimV/HubP family polar landmark protein [Vreelandella glaciei]|uniref:type IV pilus assembly protein FimV n=1 Tax=Vreelandella glaciei TaxID=186761 RepID=UPI0030035983
MKKTLTWITWLSLSAVSPFALAVGLGQASVGSYLNAPLNASIPLLESSDYALDDIQVSVAEPADFAAAGLEWTPLAASVRAQIVEQQGLRQVRLSSVQTMQEPWLDLLLAVEFPGGQQFRDITLLFDPQGYSQQGQSAAPNAVPTTSNAAPPVVEARSAASPVVSERGNGSSAYVGSGDTLWGVAERLKPSQASVQQMMVALLEANPDVFPSGNINDMRAGQTLSVPDIERILARSHLDADAAMKAMNEAWRARRNGSLEAVSLPDVEADTVSNNAIAAAQILEATGAAEADSALAAGGAEPNEQEANEPAVNDPTALEEAADEPEALTRAELTEQLRLSQATLQQVMEERVLMRAELNALRSEVASLTQALSDALAAQEQSPEPYIASMDEMGSPGVAALVERYQWPLALAAIALLLGVLVWLRKRREEAWENVPLTEPEPVTKPIVTPGTAPKAASKATPEATSKIAPMTASIPDAVPVAYPIQANNNDVEEPHQQSEPQVATEDEPEISYASSASTANADQWLIDEQAQTPEQDDTLRYENSYENSYEKSQASGLAEQGRQRRLGLHVAPDNGADHLSLAPPLSPVPMRLLLASLNADLKSAEPAAPADHVQSPERAPKRSEDAEHRFIDYHPPTLMNTLGSQEGLRRETPMQPTVEFANQPAAEPVSPAKQPRRPIEEEWEIEEVAFKPRGLDNSEPSKSSK